MFGEDRLRGVVERCTSTGLDDVVATIRQAVSEHTRDQPQYDDLTLLVLKLRPGETGGHDGAPS